MIVLVNDNVEYLDDHYEVFEILQLLRNDNSILIQQKIFIY